MQTETRLKGKRYDDRCGDEMAEINLQITSVLKQKTCKKEQKNTFKRE